MRDPRRAWLRGLLPGRLRRGRRGVRRSHRGGARRGHDRCRRLVRGGTGLRLPRLPGLRRGLPVRERDGRSALCRHGTEHLPVARGNGAADPRGVRPWTAAGTSLKIRRYGLRLADRPGRLRRAPGDRVRRRLRRAHAEPVEWVHLRRGRPAVVTAKAAGPAGGAVDGFLLAYDGFDPGTEGLREALTSTGNGYLCTRGAAEWEDADGVHYPGTYAHGGYNRETTILGGLPVLNEDLVNLPNWLILQLRIEGEDAIRLADVELVSYRHELDIRNATLVRQLRFRDGSGRETTLKSRRFVSMADPHHAGIEWTLVPENWSGRVEVISALDSRVSNAGVARYQQLEGRHLNPVAPRTLGPEVVALKAETRQSNLYISQAARTRVFRGDRPVQVERRLYQMEDYIQQVLAFDVRQGEPIRVEKLVTFFTSRDPAVSDTLVKAATSVARHTDFGASFERHAAAWEELWRVCDVRVAGEESVQLLLRLHIAHVLQVCSRNTADLDAGLPARGLNGEAYRGHVFWDELYAFPFFNVRLPEVTRGLLMYRYRRIGEARAAAREEGFRSEEHTS